MSTKIGDMAIYISANTSGLAQDLKRASGYVSSFGSAATRQMAALAGSSASLFKDALGVAGGNLLADSIKGAAGGIGGLVKSSLDLAAAAEVASMKFETILGSAEDAKALLGDLREFAAHSPLSTADANTHATRLLAGGIKKDQIVPTIGALSDVSLGDPEQLKGLIRAYTQVKATGRLQGDEWNQIANTGTLNFADLGKVLKADETQVKKLIESGTVGFHHLQMAIKDVTGEGGRFAGAGARYAQTYAGKVDKLADSWDDLKRYTGEAIIDELGLKQGADDLSSFVEDIKPLVDALRPALRFVGDLGKGLAQMAAEGGKAFVELGDVALARLNKRFPETAKWIKDTVAGLKDFKLNPDGIANFALGLADGIADAIQWAKPYWDSLVDDFVIPLRDTIMLLPNAIASLDRTWKYARTLLTEGPEAAKQGEAINKWAADAAKIDQGHMRDYGLSAENAAELRSTHNDIHAAARSITAAEARLGAALASGGDAAKPTADLAYWKDVKLKDEKKVQDLLGKVEWDSAKAYGERKKARDAQTAARGYDRWLDDFFEEAFPKASDLKIDTPQLEAKLSDLAAKLNEKLVDPAKKFADDLNDLGKIRDAGRITDDTHALAVSDLMRDAAKGAGLDKPQLASGVEAGSQQLATMIARAGVGQGPQTIEGLLKMLNDLTAQNVAAAKELVRQGAQPAVVLKMAE